MAWCDAAAMAAAQRHSVSWYSARPVSPAGCASRPPACQQNWGQRLPGHEPLGGGRSRGRREAGPGGEGVLALPPPLQGLAVLAREGLSTSTWAPVTAPVPPAQGQMAVPGSDTSSPPALALTPSPCGRSCPGAGSSFFLSHHGYEVSLTNGAALGVCSPASGEVSSRRAMTQEHATLPNASVGQKSPVCPLQCATAPADAPAHVPGTLHLVPTAQHGGGSPKAWPRAGGAAPGAGRAWQGEGRW